MQRCKVRDPAQAARMRATYYFELMQREGWNVFEVTGAFREVVEKHGMERHHDVLGCPDCDWSHGQITYCRRSPHHRDHPFHVCEVVGSCGCVLP